MMKYGKLVYVLSGLFWVGVTGVFAQPEDGAVPGQGNHSKEAAVHRGVDRVEHAAELRAQAESRQRSVEAVKARFLSKVSERAQKHANWNRAEKNWQAEGLMDASIALRREGRFKEGVEVGREAIGLLADLIEEESDPLVVAESYAQMGMIYEYSVKDFKRAAESYQLALEYNPEHPRAQRRLKKLSHYLN